METGAPPAHHEQVPRARSWVTSSCPALRRDSFSGTGQNLHSIGANISDLILPAPPALVLMDPRGVGRALTSPPWPAKAQGCGDHRESQTGPLAQVRSLQPGNYSISSRNYSHHAPWMWKEQLGHLQCHPLGHPQLSGELVRARLAIP